MRYGIVVAVLAAAAGGGAASAEEGKKPPRILRVGLGAEIVPDHIGADGTRWSPMVNFDLKREGEEFEFEAPDESFGFSLVDVGPLEIGPALNLERSRKPSRFPVPIDKVSTTIEAGAFVQLYLADSVRTRVELRKGLGGHDGWIAQASADLIARRGDDYVFSIGPRLSWADKDYQRAYFGVTPAQSVASGLPIYTPGSGTRGVGAASSLVYQFSPKWGIQAYARYERLIGDSGRSPLIRTYGSRDQISAGLALSYTFRLSKR